MVPLFSSSTVPRCLLVFFLFTVTIATTTAQPLYTYCPDGATNYTANSTFESNLNQLFSTLVANGSATGFFNFTAGSVPERVYGLVLCRGDVAAGPCSSCLSTATEGIVQQCPYKRSAVIWYDNCMLRYSNQRFFSIVDSNFRVLMMNEQNVTATAVLNQQVEAMMAGLVRYAAYNSSAPRGFATGAAAYVEPALPRIYGLVQCTRDLSADDCSGCLGQITGEIKQRFSGRRGARTLTSSCNMRYELYSFYNSSENVIIPLPANAAPPAAGSLPPVGAPDARVAGENKKGVGTVLAIVIPVSIASALTCVICICFWRRKSHKKVLINTTDTQQVTPVESLLLDLSTLRAATGNFSDLNKLGEGGFGAVYKGLLPNGEEIAVKRLSRGSSQGIDELKNEVVLLAKLQHRNLVRLLGVCWEGEEKLLVYEFVPNTSLDSFLFDPTKVDQLHWETRYKIIEGIARGLQYLHEDSQHKIIHRDLKASNILLDADMNPKISDFGLARLFGGDQTQASTTRVVGTYGYMPPEYALRGKFSNKSDVFSFGVLVLEIITGRKINSFFESESYVDLLSWVWEHWANGAALDITDPSLGGNYQRSEVLKCIQIGLLCVQDAPSSRPTMSSVVLALSSFSMSLQVPSRPAFSIGNSKSFANVLDGSLEGSTGAQEGTTSGTALYSPNEVSVTELEPR